MPSVVVYTGLVVVRFEKGWDVKIDPGRVDNIDPDRIENVIQQFDNVGKLFWNKFYKNILDGVHLYEDPGIKWLDYTVQSIYAR